MPLQGLESFTTDGRPDVEGCRNGFIALCTMVDPPRIHRISQQEIFHVNSLDFGHVINVVIWVINSIRVAALIHTT